MSNNSGNQATFSSVNVWGSGPVLSSLRITGKAIIHLLEVIGNTLFKGFVHFSNDVHFENLPTCDVYSPTYQNELATKQYVDSVATGGPIDIFNNNNIWSGTNTWENTCAFNIGRFKNFTIGEEETPIFALNTFSSEMRLSANATNINGEEYVYITGSGDVIVKGGGFGVPNPEGGALVGGTLNISSAMTTLESSTDITIEAANILITGAVESASITEEITVAVGVEEDRAMAVEGGLEEEIVVLQGEVEAIQGEIAGLAGGGAGIVAGIQGEIDELQYNCLNSSGGGKVSTSEVHLYQTNGSGNRGTITMVERDGQTKIRMAHPVDFDHSIYIDTGGYISSHGDIDVRNTSSAVKANFIRAFYHKVHALHLGADSDGERGEVRIDGTVNYFTRSIPRLDTTLVSLTPTLSNELTSKDYVDNAIAGALSTVSAPVTLGGDQTFLSGVKTFTNLPQCNVAPSINGEFSNKKYVDDSIVNAAASYVKLAGGTQTIGSGIFTFTDLPKCSTTPSNNTELVNKLYVDNAVSSIGGGGSGDVTTNTSQTISGAKTFTADTTKFGAASIYEGTAKIAILNNTLADSNVNGTISNENVYHQIQFGNRETFISQGAVDNNNTYIGSADYTSPDPNFQLTLTRGVGLKISGLGTDTTTFTEALKVIGTQRVTGIATFDVLPQCNATVTSDNQLTTKSYVDSAISTGGGAFVTLNTTQDNINGGKTFKGNCIFWPISGSTIIRGGQVDIFADVTYLTGNTTTISGNQCNITSTTNYVAGTNFNIEAGNTVIRSPYVAITNACTSLNFNATNTDFTGSVTAPTQTYTDNSTKLATTQFVNSFGNANYVTISTAQTISGIKSFSAKSTFSAGADIGATGLTSNLTGVVNVPDQTTGTNTTVVANTKFVNSSLTTALVNYVSIAGNQSISGSKYMSNAFSTQNLDIFENLFNMSIYDTGLVWQLMKPKTYNYRCDAITIKSGYVAGNSCKILLNVQYILFRTRVFNATLLLSEGIFITYRVFNNTLNTINFYEKRLGLSSTSNVTLIADNLYEYISNFNNTNDGNCLLQLELTPGHSYTFDYLVTAYLGSVYLEDFDCCPSINYNSQSLKIGNQSNYNLISNPYSCFIKNVFCGVWMIDGSGATSTRVPLYYSCTDSTNVFYTDSTAPYEPQIPQYSTAPYNNGSIGEYSYLSIDNTDNNYEVFPNYGLVIYQSVNYGGDIYVNYKNLTKNPVWVKPTIINRISSWRIFYMDKEIFPS